jgi:hypothetical protein
MRAFKYKSIVSIILYTFILFLAGCHGGADMNVNMHDNKKENDDFIPFIEPVNPKKELIIYVDDYKTNKIGEVSDWKAITAAINDAARKGASELRFNNRVYHLDDPDIMKSSNGGAHFILSDLSNMVINGQGAELRFYYILGAFKFINCNRTAVKNLVIDWDQPLASPGVAELDKRGRTVIRVAGDYRVTSDTPVQAVTEYDIKKLKWKMDGLERYYPENVELVNENTFYSPSFSVFKSGTEVLLRHYIYDAHAFDFMKNNNSNLHFEGITIYQCPGMGFIGAGCDSGFRIAGCTIKRREGTNKLISTTADGIHIKDTIGNIIIEDCDFSHMGDDALNIHGTLMKVEEKQDSRTLKLSAKGFYGVVIDEGDEIALYRKENLEEYARLTVKKGKLNPRDSSITITFDKDIPSTLKKGDYAGNLSRASNNFLIRNNYFHDHRARGMLLQSSNGLVINNRIENVMAAAIQMTTDCNYWEEGFGCENVVVKNNIIIGANYAMWERGPSGRHMAAINLVVDTKTGIGDYPVHKNIRITDNIIVDTPGLAILAASASGVVISNNTIINSNTQPFSDTGAGIKAAAQGTIMVTRASNVEISGNYLKTSMDVCDRGIYADPSSTEDIRIFNNHGFEKVIQ